MKQTQTKKQMVDFIIDALFSNPHDIAEHLLMLIFVDARNKSDYLEYFDDEKMIREALMKRSMKELKLDYDLTVLVYDQYLS